MAAVPGKRHNGKYPRARHVTAKRKLMRYICIHSHFYQPPRENPWLEAIELQDSAYPYHDWNERIAAECYAPNSATRILDPNGQIRRIINNYSWISFNFGPTLLSWMEAKAPGVYQAVLAADRESRKRFRGHGSALAQAYNHMIMPLASRRDKVTQIRWGLADFRRHFGREAEGMWLPETAVDLETLGIMAAEGVRFTILAQNQASRVRHSGIRTWRDVSGSHIDPSRPYRIRLPGRRHIDVFFYDGPVSRAVAFERLLENGERFAARLLGIFDDSRTWPQLAHIATDGETYGHHHRHGEMALAYALNYIESNGLARVTNYAEFLKLHPPTHEVEIFENSAWSCVHGVARWREHCGCNSGSRPSWNQHWRTPLRNAMDWLRDAIAPRYEQAAAELLDDPWASRDDYIQVMLERGARTRAAFLGAHAKGDPSPEGQVTIWKLMELQRHAMLMYTSCGWFFDELSGIETVQVLQYAGRVIQLAEKLFSHPFEADFVDRLREARSNISEYGDGAGVWNKFVKPGMVDLIEVGAHYAISAMFKPYPDEAQIYCYRSERQDHQAIDSGRLKLNLGRVKLTSDITGEAGTLAYGVLHFGDHNVSGGVRPFRGEQAYQTLARSITEAFSRADAPGVIRLLDGGFGSNIYSLHSLFHDEQRSIIDMILDDTLGEAENAFRQLYEHHAPFMRFLAGLGTPLPKVFRTTAEFALNGYLRRAFSADKIDLTRVRSLLEQVSVGSVELDATTLEFTLRRSMERMARQLAADPANDEALRTLAGAAGLLPFLPFSVSLWTVQNVCYRLLNDVYPARLGQAQAGDQAAQQWVSRFLELSERLSLRVDANQ
ncbi:MAG: DUF3536 domain-containing protein [Bryobacterales bacterium]|nr:DUF3536 domain-containing protein [Bryobacterales bacterium]